ncbi:14457_t:CDS:2, partial [Racocetra fulgida]
ISLKYDLGSAEGLDDKSIEMHEGGLNGVYNFDIYNDFAAFFDKSLGDCLGDSSEDNFSGASGGGPGDASDDISSNL